MTTFLTELFSPNRIEYLTVDRNFHILEKSSEVQQFADSPDEVMPGNDVRVCFPELFGLEDVLIDILERRLVNFELEGVSRVGGNKVPLYFDISISKNPTKDKIDELIILVKDVTEKILWEQKRLQLINEKSLLMSSLESAKDYITEIVKSMPSALFVTNKDGMIKTVNRAAKELFGYKTEELINQPITKIIENPAFLYQINQQHPLFNKTLKNIEVVCSTKRGEKIFVAFSCSAIQTNKKKIENYIYIGRDITQQQRFQKRQAAQYVTTRILSESTTLKQAIAKILQAICENLGWVLGEIWTPDQYLGAPAPGKAISHPTELRCVETWVQPSIAISEFTSITSQITLASGEGLPGRVWETRSPHWITDVVHDANFVRSQAASIAGLHSAFGFPIQDNKEILGVMTFISCEVHPIDEDLLQVMAGIGSQLVQFIKRKQAESVVLESEERYRELFENASDLIQCITPKGRFVYVNRAWRKTLGYSETEIAKMTAFDVIHPKHQAHCMEMFGRLMSGEKIDSIETEFLTKDGKTISVEGNINCKFTEGKPVFTRGIFRNITERKEAEAALRASEASLAEAQKIAHVGSWEFDIVTQKITWSDELFRIFGLESQQQAPTYSELVQQVHPDDRELWQTIVEQAIADGKPYEFDYRIVRPDGSIRYVNARGYTVTNDEGEVIRQFGTAMDITQRKQAEIALLHQQEQTERLLRNILPDAIANRLKQQPSTIADSFAEVTVLFADIVGFTELSTQTSPTELVEILNVIFSEFDQLAERHGLEKIKTIGDAYMVVGGLPVPQLNHVSAIAEMALDMQNAIARFRAETGTPLNIRIGINTGPVVAGVIGIRKFSYDLWGDTVNIASRMESHGLAGKIQVTAATYECLRQQYLFEKRGVISVKGKGEMITYFLLGRKER